MNPSTNTEAGAVADVATIARQGTVAQRFLPKSLADAIERVRPYFDADPLPNRWLGTELLIMGWCMHATGTRPNAADDFVNAMIDEGRNRYAAGFYANPFEEPVRIRAQLTSQGATAS